MTGERLREERAALDVGADLVDHDGEVLVVGLLGEDREAVTTFRPASIIVANCREKTWSDFGLIFFSAVRTRVLAARRQLLEHVGEQAADTQLLARGLDRRRVHLAVELEPVGVDRAVDVGGH